MEGYGIFLQGEGLNPSVVHFLMMYKFGLDDGLYTMF